MSLPSFENCRVLLVQGGNSPEREGSMRSAVDVEMAFRELNIVSEVWDLDELDPGILRQFGCAFLAVHGWYGEDGKLQGMLDLAGVPYNGSGVAASAAAMYKPFCNYIAEAVGLHVPDWVTWNPCDKIDAAVLLDRFGGRVFVKPCSGGGSLGAGYFDQAPELGAQFDSGHDGCSERMVCRWIEGIDVSVGLIEVEGQLLVLPPLATFHDAAFYDYAVKHNSALRQHACPPAFDAQLLEELRDASQRVFRALCCSGYARVDFMVDRVGQLWFLEINTLPGLSRAGNLATMAAAHGWSYEELIGRILRTIPSATRYRP